MNWKRTSLRAYVSIGSNMGDRAGNLLMGIRGMLHAGMHVACLSSIYQTEPVDVTDQPMFLNMVAEIKITIFTPEQMLARLLRVEYALGRRRDAVRGPRNIDLDLLLYGVEQRDNEFLILPHPRMHRRRFVLAPLAELAPDLILPRFGKTVSRLLEELDDRSEVKRWR